MKQVISIVYVLLHLLTWETVAQTLTLDEALQLGQANRVELKARQLQVAIARAEETKRRARWLPQVSASADLRWNTQLQTSVFKDAPFANGEDVVVKFGVPFNNLLGIQADQAIYNAPLRLERQLNQLGVDSEQASLEKQQLDIRQQITDAYYQAVFNREKLPVSDAARQRANGYLEQAQIKFNSGTLLQSDLDRFRLDLSNAELTYRTNQREYALSLDNLRYQLNLPADRVVAPADSLAQLLRRYEGVEAVGSQPVVGSRIEIRQAELDRQTNRLNQQRERARLLPTVSAYGAYFGQQFADAPNPFGANTWFPYNYVGLKVSVPLFDGGQTRVARQTYDVRAQINQLTIERLTGEFSYQTKRAMSMLAQARENLVETRLNVAQAGRILAVDRVRYDTGTLLLADYRSSEYALQTAESSYLRAVYEVLLAQLQLRRALGGS